AVVVIERLDFAVWALHAADRSLIDEQARQADRLGERAAAVAAQVQNHRPDVLGPEVGQDLGHVAGGALVLRVAAAAGVEVHVEAGQVDHAHLQGPPFGQFFLEDLAPHGAVFEHDPVAGDLVDGAHRLAGGNDLEPDDRAALAADQLHHVAQLHAHRIGDLAAIALADADNLVLLLQPAVPLGRAAGDDVGNHGHFVLPA